VAQDKDQFAPIYTPILDHVQDGRMTHEMFTLYVILHLIQDFKTGCVTQTNYKELSDLFNASVNTTRKTMRALCPHYIQFVPKQGIRYFKVIIMNRRRPGREIMNPRNSNGQSLTICKPCTFPNEQNSSPNEQNQNQLMQSLHGSSIYSRVTENRETSHPPTEQVFGFANEGEKGPSPSQNTKPGATPPPSGEEDTPRAPLPPHMEYDSKGREKPLHFPDEWNDMTPGDRLDWSMDKEFDQQTGILVRKENECQKE